MRSAAKTDLITHRGGLAGAQSSLTADVSRVLDGRLARACAAPIVVAFSGGGDSLALLLLAKAWADEAGRGLVAITVDHKLHPRGARWAHWCAARAARLGVDHRTLVWAGDKPASGIPARARAARHELLADAARALGAAVVLMGHTADDCLEAAVMRAEGGRTPTPRQWGPSPAWPQGRGVFILRPLLDLRRADLRAFLSLRGEAWIDDPANTDMRSARARARLAIAGGGVLRPEPPPSDTGDLLACVREGPAGELSLDAEVVARASSRHLRAFLGAALLCTSGGRRPPGGEALERLTRRVGAREAFTANLAGARIEAGGDGLRIMREAGDMARAGGAILALPMDQAVVWDGRFELRARVAGLTARPLAGMASRLGRDRRQALHASPPAARRAACAVTDGRQGVTCPILAGDGAIQARSWVATRLECALGAVQNEAAIWRVARAGRSPYMGLSTGAARQGE